MVMFSQWNFDMIVGIVIMTELEENGFRANSIVKWLREKIVIEERLFPYEYDNIRKEYSKEEKLWEMLFDVNDFKNDRFLI